LDVSDKPTIGHGGTKTAVLFATDMVVMIPNSVDGASFLFYWSRIVNEEIQMSQILSRLKVPCQVLTGCAIKWHDEMIPAYFSKPFTAYAKQDMFVVDRKCLASTTWPHDGSMSMFATDCENHYDIAVWKHILEPAIVDVEILIHEGLPMAGDAVNLLIVGRKSKLHNGDATTPYQVRFFGFDFSSKCTALDFNKQEHSGLFILEQLIQLALWEGLCPKSIFFPSECQVLQCELMRYYESILNKKTS
jgi:hypothetical protein